MKSIGLIIPFFSKKTPYYYDVWKYSALKNGSIDFIFFTDVDDIKEEGNIKVYKTTFAEFANLFKEKFDFEIALSAPYKFCDYRMAYGYVLKDYLKDYDFWGHCDIDLIFGDIRKFITEEILNENEKVLEHGHFCLYKNCDEINNVFMACAGYKDYDYKKCFTSSEAMYFDEAIGSRFICDKQGVKTYKNSNLFFDVISTVKPFTHITNTFKESIFRYDSALGKLYAVADNGGKLTETEIMYAHFQKRKMEYGSFVAGKDFYVVPNRLISIDKVAKVNKLFKVKGKCLYKLQRKFVHLKEFLSRYKKSGAKSIFKYKKERGAFGADLRNAKKGLIGKNDD